MGILQLEANICEGQGLQEYDVSKRKFIWLRYTKLRENNTTPSQGKVGSAHRGLLVVLEILVFILEFESHWKVLWYCVS